MKHTIKRIKKTAMEIIYSNASVDVDDEIC